MQKFSIDLQIKLEASTRILPLKLLQMFALALTFFRIFFGSRLMILNKALEEFQRHL